MPAGQRSAITRQNCVAIRKRLANRAWFAVAARSWPRRDLERFIDRSFGSMELHLRAVLAQAMEPRFAACGFVAAARFAARHGELAIGARSVVRGLLAAFAHS